MSDELRGWRLVVWALLGLTWRLWWPPWVLLREVRIWLQLLKLRRVLRRAEKSGRFGSLKLVGKISVVKAPKQ